jgi:hypothetical protein
MQVATMIGLVCAIAAPACGRGPVGELPLVHAMRVEEPLDVRLAKEVVLAADIDVGGAHQPPRSRSAARMFAASRAFSAWSR